MSAAIRPAFARTARACPALATIASAFVLAATVLTPEARAQADTPEPLPDLAGWARSLERLRVYADFRLRQEADRKLDGRDDR